jgi:mono/diheme cytochrome c family protein
MRRVGLCLGWVALTCACVGSGVAGKVGGARRAKDAVLPRVTALGDAQAGAAVALARVDGRSLAFVLDQDDADVHAVDIDARAELSVTNLGGTPAQALVTPDGHLAVSLRDEGRVSLFEVTSSETGALRWVGSFQTPSEPTGLALTPDGSTLLVTSGWGHALSAYRVSDRTLLYRVPLPREPRAVVVSDDGTKAFVSHVVGAKMSVVDLSDPSHPATSLEMIARAKKGKDGKDAKEAAKEGAKEDEKEPAFDEPMAAQVMGGLPGAALKEHDRMGCQGFALAKSTDPAGRILAPEVLVDPGDGAERSVGYGSSFQPTEVGNVAVLDAKTAKPLEASLHPVGSASFGFRARVVEAQQDCLLPRAAAYDSKSRSLFVACLGIDTIVEYDATSADPHSAELRRWRVAAGPMGVAVDGEKKRLVVWSQFDRAMTFVPYDDPSLAEDGSEDADPKPHVMLALSRKPVASTADVALGRKLFHAAGDHRISSDGRACASCHPDGRDDSLTWATPDGPRNTPMLAGRLEGTAPYGWRGANDDIKKHLTQTFQRLRGGGFEPRELEALMAFVRTMPAPGSPPDSDEARKVALVQRGEQLFRSEETGCAGCHNPAQTFTDGMKHDVGTAVTTDADHEFDTPSLKFLAGTAPYFHDGRFATLHDLLSARDSKMGNTAQLSDQDVDALEAYLRTL